MKTLPYMRASTMALFQFPTTEQSIFLKSRLDTPFYSISISSTLGSPKTLKLHLLAVWNPNKEI